MPLIFVRSSSCKQSVRARFVAEVTEMVGGARASTRGG
jgi:hypothetical protein